MLTEQECRDVVERVRSFSKADEVQVSLGAGELAHLRHARNTPSTGGLVATLTLGVQSTFGSRRATAQVNQLDRDSIETVVRRSEELALRAPEDPEFVPALGPQEYVAVPAETAEEESERLERLSSGVAGCIEAARAAGVVSAGFAEARASVTCLANSAGLFGYHRSQEAHFSQTVRTSDGRGSGWASSAGRTAGELEFERCARTAIDKARASTGARPLAPETVPAVLEPACVATLLGLFAAGMDARNADEGRSFFAREDGGTRLGETLFPDWIELVSDPAHRLVPTLPWGEDGLPHGRTEWVRSGTVQNLHCARFWAQKSERTPLAPPPNLILRDAERSLEDLIASVERGVLITDLWYVREVDPRTMLYTGLTRDGVFWIEGGKVTHPVNNFRWNESPVRVLKNALGCSRAMRVGGRGGSARNALVPALAVGEFALTSVSEAI